MSFFNKLKREIKQNIREAKNEIKKANPSSGTVYFENGYVQLYEEGKSLPTNRERIHKMLRYYDPDAIHNAYSEDRNDKKEIYSKITAEFYQMVKNGTVADNSKTIESAYVEAHYTPRQKTEYYINNFCEKIFNMFVPQGDIATDTHIVVRHSFLKARFGDRNLYSHCQQGIPQIIDAVCDLVTKESRENPMLYPGYYMYKDLMVYAKDKNKDKAFTHDVWKYTKDYLEDAYDYYDVFLFSKTTDKEKTRKAEAQKARIDQMTNEARVNIQLCSKEELLATLMGTAQTVAKEEKDRADNLARQKARAESGDATAMAELALNRFYGRNGETVDTEKAFVLFAKAEKAGSGTAAFYLGEYYSKGIGHIIKDEKQGEEYYRKAVEANSVPALALWAEKQMKSGNREYGADLYKKVLVHADKNTDVMFIKKAISALIGYYKRNDVDENTLAMYALALDYARLDAPIVKEANLLALVTETEKGTYNALDSLVEYYTYYSRGRAAMGTIKGSDIYENDQTRAMEMRHIASAFRNMKIARLIQLAYESPEKYLEDLADAYLENGNYTKAKEFADLGIKMGLPDVMYFVYHNAKKLDYDEADAMYYLNKSARMGNKRAIGALEYLGMMAESDRQRAEWVRANKPKAKTREDYAFELEMLERDIDMMIGGSGHSLEEKALMGKLSFTDASLIRHYKNKLINDLTDE